MRSATTATIGTNNKRRKGSGSSKTNTRVTTSSFVPLFEVNRSNDICTMHDDYNIDDVMDGRNSYSSNKRPHHQSSLHSFFTKITRPPRPSSTSSSRTTTDKIGKGVATPNKISRSSLAQKVIITPSPSSDKMISDRDTRVVDKNTCSSVGVGRTDISQEDDAQSTTTTTSLVTSQRQQEHQQQQIDSNKAVTLPTETTTLSYSSSSATVIETQKQKQHLPKQQQKQQRSLTQVYIDCGQSTFGQVLCPKCGMLYMPGIREDEQQHVRLCQSYSIGILCLQGNVSNGKLVQRTVDYSIVQWKSCRVSATSTTKRSSKRRMTMTTTSSTSDGICENVSDPSTGSQFKTIKTTVPTTNYPSQWPLLAQMISRDLGMEESTVLKHLTEQIVFLYIGRATTQTNSSTVTTIRPVVFNTDSTVSIGTKTITSNGRINNNPPPSRILGVVTVQLISHAYRMHTLHDRSLVPERAILGVGLLWTHSSARRCGVATRLVTAARDYAIFGMRVPTHRVAFSSPTQAGYAFTWKYCCSHQDISVVPPTVDGEGRSSSTTSNGTYNDGMIDQQKVGAATGACSSKAPLGPLVYEMV